jgi:hypothetical protein
MKIKSITNQTIFDLAIETAGSVSGIFDMIKSNPVFSTLGLLTPIIPGMVIKEPDVKFNEAIYNHYKANNFRSATDYKESLLDMDLIITKEENYVNMGRNALLKYN